MKLKKLTLAVAGALVAPAALAAGPTMYGVLDLSYTNSTYTNAAGSFNKHFMNSGALSGSRLGVRGDEDLAPGLTARYVIEMTITGDTGAAINSARQTYVGFDSKSWGSLTFGRQYTHTFHTAGAGELPAIVYGTIASPYALEGHTTRASNAFKYASPNWSGWTLGFLWNPSETTTGTTKKNGEYWDGAVRYSRGPLTAALSYARTNVNSGAATNYRYKETVLGANYDFGKFSLAGGYHSSKSSGLGAPATGFAKSGRVWSLQGGIDVTAKGQVFLSYYKVDDKTTTNVDSKGIALGYIHSMSKRTTLYGVWGRMNNNTTATRLLGTQNGAAVPAGYDPKALQLGMRHTF